MGKKPKSKKAGNRKTGADKLHPLPPPLNPRATESVLADIHALIDGRDFESLDELNEFLHQSMIDGPPPKRAPRTDLEKAQAVMYEAWESTGKRRVELALRALTISPLCADAFVLLAEEGTDMLSEAMGSYAMGVIAGRRAIADIFDESVGEFWGILETRPYMRARAGLAACLADTGEESAAAAIIQDMLVLNPGDNQGMRYRLVGLLFGLERWEELTQLLKAYGDEPTADWRYARALLSFLKNGAGAPANKLLLSALKVNSHVPPYILGVKDFPDELPEYFSIGDEAEAICCAANLKEAWSRTPRALDWLRAKSGN